MTQVELPQLSLQRYVDLVKRRRWQLVPVSLLGLVIGGLVAFFIPRYFVAQTLLEHQQVPSGPADTENPFRAVVDTAKSTIPLMAGAAIDELKWPEALGLDGLLAAYLRGGPFMDHQPYLLTILTLWAVQTLVFLGLLRVCFRPGSDVTSDTRRLLFRIAIAKSCNAW